MEEFDVLPGGQFFPEDVELGADPDDLSHAGDVLTDVDAVDQGFTSRLCQRSDDDVDEGRLARPVLPQQRHDFPPLEVGGDPLEGKDPLVVGLLQVGDLDQVIVP
jgi:hypothetical protein